jgi:hypothetical protein
MTIQWGRLPSGATREPSDSEGDIGTLEASETVQIPLDEDSTKLTITTSRATDGRIATSIDTGHPTDAGRLISSLEEA